MTEFIAQIAGPYWLVTGLGFILSRPYYERMIAGSPASDPVLVNLSGAAHFVLGAILFANHFLWSHWSEIAVSLLGIMLLAKGSLLIMLPETTLRAPQNTGVGLTASTIGFLSIGTLYCFIGYWPLLAL